MSARRVVASLLGILASATPTDRSSAQAAGMQAVTIRNASFEENVLAVGQFRAPVTGWDAYLGNESYGSYRPTNYSYADYAAPEGSNLLFLNPGVGIQQTLDAVLRPNATYTLSFVVAQRADVLGGPYAIDLMAGSTVLASDANSLAPAPGTWLAGRVAFTAEPTGAPIGEPLQIRVRSTGDGQPNFDSFSLVTDPDPWIRIRNPSFEENVLAVGQFRAPVTGWDAFIGNESYGSYRPTNYSYADYAAPDGNNVLFLNPGAGIRQTLDAVLQPDASYTLSYLVGQRADVLSGPFELAVRAGSTLIATDAVSSTPEAGTFVARQLAFSSGSAGPGLGEALEISVRSTGDGQPNFDSFSLRVDPTFTAQTTVPEPATWWLLGPGLVALAPLARRRYGASR